MAVINAVTDVVERAVESPFPVAVVDERQRLIGVIPRVTLLAALGNVPAVTRENPVIDLPATVTANEMTQTMAVVGDAPGALAAEGATR